MSFEWFIAKRYIREHRRNRFLSFITSFAILGIMLGTAALNITLSILDGFEREIKEKVIGFSAHIQVQGFSNHALYDYQSSLERVKQEISNVKAISPFVAKEGMIRSKETVDGVFLKGVDPSVDVSEARRYLVKGTFVSATNQNVHEIVVGKKLAQKLNVDLGDKLVVFGLPSDEGNLHPRAMQFQLAGIYESGMAEYDDIYAYTSLQDAQNLFQFNDAVSGFDILVKDLTNIDETAKEIQKLLGYPHFARTVFQSYRNLFSWVELQKKMSPILMALIIIVATVNIIGTILMLVLEKTEAIGILKSLGASQKVIQRVFVLQGLIIALLGVVLGNVLSFILCWLQLKFRYFSLPSDIYFMSSVPILLKISNFVLVSIIAFVLSVVTTVLPARLAAKLDTVRALRFG